MILSQKSVSSICSGIKQLSLRYFRNHTNLSISPQEATFVFISGANGAGKTNVLEAISLLIPGKGLKGARADEILSSNQELSNAWAVEATIGASNGDQHFLTGAEIQNGKPSRRTFRLNEQPITKQQHIAQHLRIIWLTPQTDSLFLSAAGVRRKFWDRMSYNLNPAHAQNISEYEYYAQSRNKLLQETNPDRLWLARIETQLAEAASKIIANRIASLQLIRQHLTLEEAFIAPNLEMIGAAVEEYQRQEDFTSWFAATLQQNRRLDAHMGRMKLSASKMDFIALHPRKAISAAICSTGEQKSLLISLILAQSRAILRTHNISPILLLDDILENLDRSNRGLLLQTLAELNIQAWITATEDLGLMPADTVHVQL